MHLLTQFIEPHLVDEILYAALDLASRRLGLGVISVGDGDEADTRELEAANDTFTLDLIARQAAQIINHQNIDLAIGGGRKHGLISGTIAVRATHRLICIRFSDAPSFCVYTASTVPELVVDAR
ncbi:hypothetical protein GCM10011487_12550 [Steroidobacter agaridevorans]|uniref:Uncharacterized protein n=1 Tax=Steroidobacter agaridevorans TaxID=2695856 RepID=A0A829Y8E1_9GAMM|nr:hypothetical protein GCM10011487_12550 [Steroidobacter agaridevorans]